MQNKTEQAFLIELQLDFVGGSNQTSGSNYNFFYCAKLYFYYDPAVAKIVLSNYLTYILY